MPALSLPATTIAITAAAIGSVTCTSTAGLYAGQKGWAVKSDGSGNLQVFISKVLSTTTFLCQDASKRCNAGGVDLTLYNGGNIYFDAQVVSTQLSGNTQPLF